MNTLRSRTIGKSTKLELEARRTVKGSKCRKISIIEPDKLNDDIIEIFLNIMNDHANRIKDDYTITVEGNKMSSLNSKKATKLIK